ncbi:MAG: DUF5719 family protein [Actinomycetota bacterium]|nr:DUF5719 family protein [Actinomycetota bacterium]
MSDNKEVGEMANSRRLRHSVAVVVPLLVLLAMSVAAPSIKAETTAATPLGWQLVDAGTSIGLTGVANWGKDNVYIGGANPSGILLWSHNGGGTWNRYVPPRQALDISIAGANDAWAIGLDRILHTLDGGTNWSEIDTGLSQTYWAIWAVDTQTVWVVGEGGAIARTTDGGAHWQSRKKTGYSSFLRSVTAVSAQTAWALGTDGSLIKTTDGGAHWTVNDMGTVMSDIWAVNSQVIWAVGSGIYKSTNGGSTWNKQLDPQSQGSVSVCAVDENTAWAVGGRGTIWKTVDGGKTWFPQSSGVTAELTGVAAADAKNAWAVGEGGIVLHTTDGGGYRNPPRISSIAPTSGRVGAEVTIRGTDFGDTRDSSYVGFGSIDASEYTAWSDTRISAKVPAGASGQVELKVVTPGGISNPKTFTVITPTYYSYYFAEGCTREGFNEWLCLQNPGKKALEVTATYMLAGGAPIEKTYTIDATSRTSINVNEDIGPGQDVSVMLLAEGEFYAERPMYFNYKMGQPGFSWTGGHCVTGAVSPGCDWYFAEGTTREGFEEWICIQNPNSKAVNVKVFYISAGAYMQQKEYNVPAHSRVSVFVNGDVGPGQDVSVHVHCDDSIVAERPMYFNYHSKWDGGHVVMGADFPKNLWYFAEGSTQPGFEEWLAVQNANPADAHITVHFFKGDGTQQSESYTVGSNSRWTLDVSVPLGQGVDSSMTIESDQPVVAERPMYFNYNGWTGGHDVLGSSTDKTSWFFAEGCTREGFDEYICIGNPGSEKAHVTITFMLGTGEQRAQQLDISARARATLNVAGVIGRGHDVSARVQADKPVVAERPMYFNYNGWTGGHDVVGF